MSFPQLVASAAPPSSSRSLRATPISLSCTFRVLPFPSQHGACAPLQLNFSTSHPKASRFQCFSYQGSYPRWTSSCPEKSTRMQTWVSSEHWDLSSLACKEPAKDQCRLTFLQCSVACLSPLLHPNVPFDPPGDCA